MLVVRAPDLGSGRESLTGGARDDAAEPNVAGRDQRSPPPIGRRDRTDPVPRRGSDERHRVLKSFADGTLFGEQTGTGRPSVLGLHGWGRTHADLREVLRDHDAVAVDLPGFGASPTPTTAWSTAEYAAALDPLVDTMRRPIVIVGHSFGGRVALHLAVRRPASVAALVLCGVPLLHRSGRPARPAAAFRLARALNRVGIVSDGRMDELRERYGSQDYRNASGVMREILVKAVNESYESQIEAVTCPVELVWGDRDTAAPPEIATRAETMFADARLTIVGDVDHFVPIHRPEPLRTALQRRLEAAAR